MNHIEFLEEGTEAYKAAMKTLTLLGQYHKGYQFGDLGLEENWKAYQRERSKLGLPAAQ